MLGYTRNNKDLFKGNAFEFNLKKAVAYSGGNGKHYNFFKELLTYSVVNSTTKKPLHDSRAAQLLTHLFPVRIQVFLSILFYQYELRLIEEFGAFSLDSSNILLPSRQLLYNSVITKNSISNNILMLVDNILAPGITVNDNTLAELKRLFNVEFTVNDLDGRITDNVSLLLDRFRIPSISKTQYLQIVKTNDRLQSGILTTQALNYKPKSINYLAEAISLWQQNSNI